MRFSLLRIPSARRWIHVLLLSAFVLVLLAIFETTLVATLQKWRTYSSEWSPLLRFATGVVITAVLTLALIRLGALGVRFRFKTMLRYPPIWLSLMIAIMINGAVMMYDKGATISGWVSKDPDPLVGILFVALLGILVAFAYHGLQVIHSSPSPSPGARSDRAYRIRSIFDNDQDLLSWILEEIPIQHPNQDIFGHALPAQRIARLLLKKASSNIGIVGPYGSGKSSLVNLVEYYLTHPASLPNDQRNEQFSGEILYCRIDGWGRASGKIAQQILSLAIEEVKKHVDCTSIIALPENYRKALEGASSTGGAFISALLQSTPDPVSQLCRLDDILAAAHMRLVIILEDLDRNVTDQIVKDEMPALLDRLRVLDNVSFVLAIGTERQFSDILIRICDHVEAMA